MRIRHPDRPGLHIRIVLANGLAMGPGRADLLDAIVRTGSISAAARAIGMSYKRAWDLHEAINASFADPLIATARGGASGGGAALTPNGERVLALYRDIQTRAAEATETALTTLNALASPTPDDRSG